MPIRQRQPNDFAMQVLPLVLLGAGLVSSNRMITIIDDEALVLDMAVHPVRETLALFFSGNGQNEHPPLFDLILHFWLRATGGNFDYLRIPSILFFLAGLFLLGRASRRFSAASGGLGVIWLGLLWPFGFHFARMATWYSFSVFLVAGLTVAYFKYLEKPDRGRWIALFVFGAALLWTNYFGWAMLACLALDQVLRARAKEPVAAPKALVGLFALLCVAFLPLVRVFVILLRNSVNVHQGPLTIVANTAFNVYSLFVSESVAPWYWRFSVPAGIAILICMAVAAWFTPKELRRFFLYGLALIVVMAVLGILNTKRLLMISPWILLPLGVAIDAEKPRWATLAYAASLLVIAATGWYGIYTRRYYSAPRFIEPWEEVAQDAAGKIGNGATVIADHPSFMFYLTYLLRVPSQADAWEFQGMMPDSVKDPRVFSPADWVATSHPITGKILLIRGGRDSMGNGPMDEAARQLDQSCGSISSRLRMRDEGYRWKQRFFPQLGEPQWRIEIREYDCDASNSKQIYRIPRP